MLPTEEPAEWRRVVVDWPVLGADVTEHDEERGAPLPFVFSGLFFFFCFRVTSGVATPRHVIEAEDAAVGASLGQPAAKPTAGAGLGAGRRLGRRQRRGRGRGRGLSHRRGRSGACSPGGLGRSPARHRGPRLDPAAPALDVDRPRTDDGAARRHPRPAAAVGASPVRSPPDEVFVFFFVALFSLSVECCQKQERRGIFTKHDLVD